MISIVFGLHPSTAGKLKQPKHSHTAYIFRDFSVMSKPKPAKSLAPAYSQTVFFWIL